MAAPPRPRRGKGPPGSRTVAVWTSRLAAATCPSSFVKIGSRNTRHHIGSGRRRGFETATRLHVLVLKRHLGQMRIRLDEVGPHHAARQQSGRPHRREEVPERSQLHQWAPPRAPPILGDSNKQNGATIKAMIV